MFWNPKYVVENKAFQTKSFLDHVSEFIIGFKLTQPGPHSQNKIDSKRGITRSILSRTKDVEERHFSSRLAAIKAVFI